MADLLVIVPTRSRPHNIERLLAAWTKTGAWGVADLLIAVDQDDPALPGYQAIALPEGATLTVADVWRPMVHKLNHEACQHVGEYFALGFMGDDHEPITPGWAGRYVDALRRLGSGFVYCRDDYQDEKLPTQWAITSDIVRVLGGRMTPADVEHLYCDNAILDLGRAADCIAYLGPTEDDPEGVLIRHNHYLNGLAPSDDQYQAVNSRAQYRVDRPAYQQWLADGLARDAAKVRGLRGVVEPLWTILVPTLGQRRDLFQRLLDRLLPQVDAARGAVKVVAYWNNGERTLPDIRQTLVETCGTEYLCFVDDDDLVSEDYVASILAALESRPDYVGFRVQCYTDGQRQGVASHSLRHGRWFEDYSQDPGLFRDISHLNPIRASAAKQADFRLVSPGRAEDRRWAFQLRKKMLLQTEVMVERVLYHYLWSQSISAWQKPADSIRDAGVEPARPASPHFSYHPQCAAVAVSR